MSPSMTDRKSPNNNQYFARMIHSESGLEKRPFSSMERHLQVVDSQRLLLKLCNKQSRRESH